MAREQHKRQKQQKKKDIEGKTCGDCRYCMKGKYGFYDCAVRQNAVSEVNKACYRYMEKYPEQRGETWNI